MTNRIAGNVIIIDSQMGAKLISPGTGNYETLYVNAIALSMADTSATVSFSADTLTDIVVVLNKYIPHIRFASPQKFNNLKVPALSNGTAWIYLA